VLHRAAFGPREAVQTRVMAGGRSGPREPADPRAGPLARAAGWLRDNL